LSKIQEKTVYIRPKVIGACASRS
jgi:hypothetical protein